MNCDASPDALRQRFERVADTIAAALAAASPRFVALVAKWDKADLVPGLSDLDFRIVADEAATADDWVRLDQAAGRVHLEMVRAYPEWNRINEHPAGAGLTLGELASERGYNPEYPCWTLWRGRDEWFGPFRQQVAARPFDATDEEAHAAKFLAYYSPYRHGIDPPINLGPFEPKYALHSRCWHYFAPPMYAAACVLARRKFAGKRQALAWLAEHTAIRPQVEACLARVDAHYETAELTDPAALAAFERELFRGFEALYDPLAAACRFVRLDPLRTPAQNKAALATAPADPLGTLLDSVRFARIRAGRYYFYLHAPPHFDARWLLANEFQWLRKLTEPAFASLRTLLGDAALAPEECLDRLGVIHAADERAALRAILALAATPADEATAPRLLAGALETFPLYYRLLERALAAAADKLVVR